jgi:hypothetical protein
MGFALSRLTRADRIVALGALALLAFMFLLDWFGESVKGALPGRDLSSSGTGASGWQAFTNSRWVWLLTIVVALACVLAAAAGRRLERPLRGGELVLLLGGVSALLILFRIVHHPSASASFGGFHASSGIRFGIWLGLAAALTVAGGGYLQTRPLQAALGTPASAPATDGGAFTGLTAPREGAREDPRAP